MKNILVGGQYGDEGKGKIISHLALSDNPEIVARGGVGPNAGHKVLYEGKLVFAAHASLRIREQEFQNHDWRGGLRGPGSIPERT